MRIGETVSTAICIDANNDGNWEKRLIVGKEARIESRSETDLYDCTWMRSIVNNVNRPSRRYLWIVNWKQSRLRLVRYEQRAPERVSRKLETWIIRTRRLSRNPTINFLFVKLYYKFNDYDDLTEVEFYWIRERLNKNCSSWLESRLICVLVCGCWGARCSLWCAKESEGRGSMSHLWYGLRCGWWMPRLEININNRNGKTETDAFSKW